MPASSASAGTLGESPVHAVVGKRREDEAVATEEVCGVDVQRVPASAATCHDRPTHGDPGGRRRPTGGDTAAA